MATTNATNNVRYDAIDTYEMTDDTSFTVLDGVKITSGKADAYSSSGICSDAIGLAATTKTFTSKSTTGQQESIGVIRAGLVLLTGLVEGSSGTYKTAITKGDYVSLYFDGTDFYLVKDTTAPIGKVVEGNVDSSGTTADETGNILIELNLETEQVVSGEISYPLTVPTTKKIQFRDTGIYIQSSVDGQLDIVADGKIAIANVLDVADAGTGGASNGSIIKKTLQAGEAYTGTTAGLMVKNYGEDGTETVPSGEFCAIYANLKGLHTDPGNNTSIISAHVHGSNTTVVHAGIWLYGDMTNGLKMSGSTLTSAIDISQATAVTNIFSVPAAGTAPVTANALVPSAAPDAGTVGADACLTVDVGGTPYYIALYDTLHA